MFFFLRLATLIDRVSEQIGIAARWLVLAAVLISSGNAVVRYFFNTSSNAWLELQWYLFAAVVLLSAPYALLKDEHVRIDVITGALAPRTRAWIDVAGTILFLLPLSLLMLWLSWPLFADSFRRGEVSADAGGLIRWPVKLLLPVGFLLLALQAVSELIKRMAFLKGRIADPGCCPTEPAAVTDLRIGNDVMIKERRR